MAKLPTNGGTGVRPVRPVSLDRARHRLHVNGKVHAAEAACPVR